MLKKFIFRHYILLVLIIISCNSDDSINNELIGQWKLTKIESYGIIDNEYQLITIDYADKNVIYDFKSRGILNVIGGESEGQYNYDFMEDYLSNNPNSEQPKILIVKIDNAKWTYNFQKGVMRLGQSYIDGVDLYFERE